MTRIGISTRVFGLAAAIGLAAAANVVPEVAGSFLLICAIAALASIPQPTETARQIVPILEGALVGLTLAIGEGVSEPLALYLAVPALMAGLVGGALMVAVTIFAEVAMIGAVLVVGQDSGLLPATLLDVLPWILTGIGIGLLGSWIRRLRSVPTDEDHAGYVVAHRLLDELRVVSRRLSSGLDPVEQSRTLLDDCLGSLQDAHGVILMQSNGGSLISVAQHLGDTMWDARKDPMVARCWTTGEPAKVVAVATPPTSAASQPAAAGAPTLRCERWAIPLRVGQRMVGVLALDLGVRLTDGQLSGLTAVLDERALPLETAMLFEEVRALATVEERHRLAREIHDGVAQELASLGYLVDDLALASNTDRAAGVAHVRNEATRIVDDLRLSIFDLRSQVSRTTGLGSVLAEYLREMGARSGTAIHLTLDETPGRLRPDVEEQLLRIVQEAVTNARKHSGAGNLWVSCRIRPPAADLTVEDDGSGVLDDARKEGFGLSIMRERANRIGATVTLSPRAGGGTRVTIGLPLPHQASVLALGEPPSARASQLPTDYATNVAAHG